MQCLVHRDLMKFVFANENNVMFRDTDILPITLTHMLTMIAKHVHG